MRFFRVMCPSFLGSLEAPIRAIEFGFRIFWMTSVVVYHIYPFKARLMILTICNGNVGS
jgi:hypothetical protein